MAIAWGKFLGVWLIATLVCALCLFLIDGRTNSLRPEYQDRQIATCNSVQDTFSSGEKEKCRAEVARELERSAQRARSAVLYWHFVNAAVVLVLGLSFVTLVVKKDEEAGVPADFVSLRRPWFGFLLAILFCTLAMGVVAQVSDVLGKWAPILTQSRAWGFPAAMMVVWAAIFWLGSIISTPPKMRPSIPFA